MSDLPAPPPPSLPDPATAALEDAVSLAFRILKGVMAVLVALFVLSGLFTVAPHEEAFVSRLGSLDPTPRGPGTHAAIPVVDRVVRVDTRPREVLSQSFDLRRSDEELQTGRLEPRRGPIDPRREGYLVSGDANLVHVTLAARVRPRDAHRVLLCAADLDALVVTLLERAAVREAGRRPVEELLGQGKADFTAAVRLSLQRGLDELESGLVVEGVDLERDLIAPPQVLEAFQSVAQAAQEAERQRGQTQTQVAQLDNRAALEAANSLSEARTQARQLTEDALADAQVVADYREQWRRDPRLLRRRRVSEVLAEGLGRVEEVFVVGVGPLRLRLERDARAIQEEVESQQEDRFREVHGGQ